MLHLGFLGPNAVARALAPQGANAGSASAIIGTMQFGAIAGAVVAALPATSAVPMTMTMAGCALLGNLTYRTMIGRR